MVCSLWATSTISSGMTGKKLEKTTTNLSFVLRCLQEKCIDQCNGVGLDFLVGAATTERKAIGLGG